MCNRVLGIVLIASLVGLVGCSYSVEFAVVNKGKMPLMATYRAYDPDSSGETCPSFESVAPQLFDWKKHAYYLSRMPFPDNAVQYDQVSCRITVQIEPGMASSLGRWSPWEVDVAALGPVRLESKDGWVEYSGSELLERVKQKSRSLWALIHKPAKAAV